tara:strand:- start:2448 stop:2669 length:222 start_codon:yes stop_codon:yes gene_type:complete
MDKEILEEGLQQIKDELTRAYAHLDINAINSIFAPHGRKVFNSHEEFMATATERATQKMKEHFSRQKAFEEEE